MFVVPGTEDWNECSNRTEAWKSWSDAFLLFNQRWDHKDAKGKVIERDIQAYHMLNHFENFAFVTQGVLFIGIHEVGGIMTDPEEFQTRNDYNYDWITGMVNTHFSEVRAVVIFANYLVHSVITYRKINTNQCQHYTFTRIPTATVMRTVLVKYTNPF
jgi:hypothetical protein